MVSFAMQSKAPAIMFIEPHSYSTNQDRLVVPSTEKS